MSKDKIDEKLDDKLNLWFRNGSLELPGKTEPALKTHDIVRFRPLLGAPKAVRDRDGELGVIIDMDPHLRSNAYPVVLCADETPIAVDPVYVERVWTCDEDSDDDSYKAALAEFDRRQRLQDEQRALRELQRREWQRQEHQRDQQAEYKVHVLVVLYVVAGVAAALAGTVWALWRMG